LLRCYCRKIFYILMM